MGVIFAKENVSKSLYFEWKKSHFFIMKLAKRNGLYLGPIRHLSTDLATLIPQKFSCLAIHLFGLPAKINICCSSIKWQMDSENSCSCSKPKYQLSWILKKSIDFALSFYLGLFSSLFLFNIGLLLPKDIQGLHIPVKVLFGMTF